MKNQSMECFADWTRWVYCVVQDRAWQRLIHEDIEDLFRFEIAATEDQLPTPNLLVVWGGNGQGSRQCILCAEKTRAP